MAAELTDVVAGLRRLAQADDGGLDVSVLAEIRRLAGEVATR